MSSLSAVYDSVKSVSEFLKHYFLPRISNCFHSDFRLPGCRKGIALFFHVLSSHASIFVIQIFAPHQESSMKKDVCQSGLKFALWILMLMHTYSLILDNCHTCS